MTRRAATVAFDDQVAATIRDLGSGTTGHIVKHLEGTRIIRSPRQCTCTCGHKHQSARTIRITVTSDEVRPALRRLARKGLVVEIPTPQSNNHGGHLWLWTGDDPTTNS